MNTTQRIENLKRENADIRAHLLMLESDIKTLNSSFNQILLGRKVFTSEKNKSDNLASNLEAYLLLKKAGFKFDGFNLYDCEINFVFNPDEFYDKDGLIKNELRNALITLFGDEDK